MSDYEIFRAQHKTVNCWERMGLFKEQLLEEDCQIEGEVQDDAGWRVCLDG